MQPFENAENPLLMFRSDANAVVFNADADEISVAFIADFDDRLNAGRHKLDRVGDQIGDDLDEHCVMAEYLVARTLNLKDSLFLVEFPGKLVKDILKQPREANRLRLKIH